MGIVSAAFLVTTLATALLLRAGGPRLPRADVLIAASAAFAIAIAPQGRDAVALGLLVAAGYVAARLAPLAARLAALLLLALGVIASWWLLQRGVLPTGDAPAAVTTLGLSYVMFRVIHLVVDARDGQLGTPLTLRTYLAYVAFFPALLAGPVQRYQDFVPQLTGAALLPDRAQWLAAGERMLTGVFKCLVLAGLAWEAHRACLAAFPAPGQTIAPALQLAGAALAYAAWLYAGFSGYMDLAIGAARLVGIDLPENFDHPLRARNFLELWSRWHITLSDWFRFYIFNPSVKALLEAFPHPAVAPWLGALGYFLAFFLMGLWHGQTAALVLYGLALGAGVSANKVWQVAMARRLGRKPYAALGERAPYRLAAQALGLAYFVAALAFLWLPGEALARAGALPAGLAFTLLLPACAALASGDRAIATIDRALAAPTGRALVALAQVAAIAATLAAGGAVPSLLYERL